MQIYITLAVCIESGPDNVRFFAGVHRNLSNKGVVTVPGTVGFEQARQKTGIAKSPSGISRGLTIVPRRHTVLKQREKGWSR